MADIVNSIIDTIKEAESDGPSSTTYIVDLDYDDKGNRWAVVLGWVDYDGDDAYELCGKIAYLPKNSYMKDYDYDWEMPYDEETGEVWDTEISNPSASDAAWWLDQWEMIKKEYINAEDEDIESSTDIQSSKMYELTPTDGRKSFYGKAKVLIDDDGSETLYSYDTPIIRRDKNGELSPLWDGYSATTGRHIASFAGLNKKQYMDLLKKKGVKSSTKSNSKKITASYSSYDDLLDNWKEQLDQRWDMMDDEERASYNNDYLEFLEDMNGVSFVEEDFRQPMDRSSQYYDIRVGRGDPMYLSDEEWKKLEHYFHHEIYDEIAAESVYQFLQDKLDELPDAPW